MVPCDLQCLLSLSKSCCICKLHTCMTDSRDWTIASGRGPHTFFVKQGQVLRWPGYTVNMLHYEDAASLCYAVRYPLLAQMGTVGDISLVHTSLCCLAWHQSFLCWHGLIMRSFSMWIYKEMLGLM